MAKRHQNRPGDLESLFSRLEELVLAGSGADEFEEVFQLVIAKLWAEHTGAPEHFRAYESAARTREAVVALLRSAERGWPGVIAAGVTPKLSAEHLDVCVRAFEGHVLADAGLEVMDAFFERLVARRAKARKGQYFTPRPVVELCVRMLDPQPEETLVDPACGSGGFLIHARNHVARTHGLGRDALRAYSAEKLRGVDIDARAVRIAKALMILAGGEGANVRCANSLRDPLPAAGYDVVVTNPPFAGDVRERDVLDAFALARGRKSVERDVLFLERCLDLLRPGGRMAIVLPHNKLASERWAYARRWLLERARVRAVVGLGRNTFLPHTHQKAGVLFVEKRLRRAPASPDERVFLAISERDGKDAKGRWRLREGAAATGGPWNRVDHDLDDVAEAYRRFGEREVAEVGP